MKMLHSLVSAALFSTARASSSQGRPVNEERSSSDQVISHSVTDSAYDAGFGAQNQLTTINANVDYWINGGSTHNFAGNIHNWGRLFVSQTAYLKTSSAGGQTSDWVGHDDLNGNLINYKGALIQLNDYGSSSAPTYDWYIHSMDNRGTIQWCGRGDTGGSTYQMYNDLVSNNTGLISFEQFFDNDGASFVWRNPTLSTTSGSQNLYNDGAFRLINVDFHNVQNIYGDGCWEIGSGGTLYLEDGTGVYQNPTAGPSFPDQSILFQDPTGVLHMDTAVYSRNSNFGARVFGFGQGNAIEFYQTISSFRYDSNGILTVSFVGGNVANITIGRGYNGSNFAKRNNPTKYANYNAIFYDGAAPSQSLPWKCALSAPICSNLSGGLPPRTSSTTSQSKPTTTTTKTSLTTKQTKPTTTTTKSTHKPTTKPTTTTTKSTHKPTTTHTTSSLPTCSCPCACPNEL